MRGMLWLMVADKKKKPADHIRQAVDYFQEKYGARPPKIQASKKDFPEETVVAGYRIVPATNVLKSHLIVCFPDGIQAGNGRGDRA